MVFTNSQIGYATGTLSDPTTYSDSLIGYATGTLTDPAPPASPYGPSLIGYATGSLSDPVGGFGPSLIGYATGTLLNPHRPIAVVKADGTLAHVPILTWDGTRFR